MQRTISIIYVSITSQSLTELDSTIQNVFNFNKNITILHVNK